jgi:polyisoprenoid-binding protein YceI
MNSCAFLAAASAIAVFSTSAISNDLAKLEAPAGDYVVDKTHATLTWRVKHMGMSNYTARFKSFDAKVRYDPANPSNNSVDATIDLASVETDFVPQGDRDFNAELRSDRFFNVGKAQQATFASKTVTMNGPRSMKVVGSLSFLGVNRPVTLDVVLNGAVKEHPLAKVPWLGISARGKVQRTAFGLNPMPQLTGIGDDVEVVIEAEFVKQ